MEFPVALLHPETGRIEKTDVGIIIEVPLAPFELALEDGIETVATSIRMEGVPLPSASLAVLQDRAFKFPRNPEAGYVDASGYVEHAHHPVDVTSLRFGKPSDGVIPTEIEGILCFEFEGLGDYQDTDFSVTATLHSSEGEH